MQRPTVEVRVNLMEIETRVRTAMRNKRPKTATREKHETPTRADRPAASLAAYWKAGTPWNVGSVTSISAPGRERC